MQNYPPYPRSFETYMTQLFDTIEGRVYTNSPGDRGGPTKFGITLAALRHARGHMEVQAKDVQILTEEEARKIYYAEYLTPLMGDKGWPWPVQLVLLDAAINHGVANSAMFMQDVLNSFGVTPRLKVDGAFGVNSRAALADVLTRIMPEAIANRHCLRRMEFYLRIIQDDDNPNDSINQEKWAMGWWVRLAHLLVMER